MNIIHYGYYCPKKSDNILKLLQTYISEGAVRTQYSFITQHIGRYYIHIFTLLRGIRNLKPTGSLPNIKEKGDNLTISLMSIDPIYFFSFHIYQSLFLTTKLKRYLN